MYHSCRKPIKFSALRAICGPRPKLSAMVVTTGVGSLGTMSEAVGADTFGGPLGKLHTPAAVHIWLDAQGGLHAETHCALMQTNPSRQLGTQGGATGPGLGSSASAPASSSPSESAAPAILETKKAKVNGATARAVGLERSILTHIRWYAPTNQRRTAPVLSRIMIESSWGNLARLEIVSLLGRHSCDQHVGDTRREACQFPCEMQH